MVRPKRNQQHPNLQKAIKETARKQIAGRGAATLSLRAIARELGITAPAIYNYYPSRDELVTALIVDAYHALAEDLAAARDAHPRESHAERFLATAHAYREWALAHPSDYNLVFGTPIPGYHAPVEITSPAAARSMSVLISVLDTAHQAGKLVLSTPSPALLALLQPWIDKFEYGGPPAVIHLALASWSQIHGLVSLELFGHFTPGPAYSSPKALFEAEIQAMQERMGMG
ncbi:MAG: TetR/AcrR family transcriptional regulator [Chloroflexi bacterium]|nr:TetR/AcrR family transcriptional regulator [Chloroflexota bacterium]